MKTQHMKLRAFGWFMKAVVLGGIFIVASGYVVMALWNWLLPSLVGVAMISFWQALGLLLLSRILIGGFGRRRGWHGHNRHHWKHRMKQKWDGMSPDERDTFKDKWMAYCGRPTDTASAPQA